MRKRPSWAAKPSKFVLLAYSVMACAAGLPLALPMLSGQGFDALLLFWDVPVILLAVLLSVGLLARGPGTHRQNGKVWLAVCFGSVVGSAMGAGSSGSHAISGAVLLAGLCFGTLAPILWLVREVRRPEPAGFLR